jgi:hypothetical protein
MPITPEQKEQMLRQIAENRARQEAQNRRQLLEEGQVQLGLMPSAEDTPINADPIQAEFSAFGRSLAAGDVQYSQWAIAMDAVDANGYPLPEFIVKNLKPSRFAAITAALSKWLEGRPGRKVRVQVGDLVVEAQTPEEAEQMLRAAMEVLEAHGKSPPD